MPNREEAHTVCLYIPKELFEKVKEAAKSEYRPVSNFITKIILEYFQKQQ